MCERYTALELDRTGRAEDSKHFARPTQGFHPEFLKELASPRHQKPPPRALPLTTRPISAAPFVALVDPAFEQLEVPVVSVFQWSSELPQRAFQTRALPPTAAETPEQSVTPPARSTDLPKT